MAKKKPRSITRSIGVRAFEQLAALGIVFFLTPYLQAQLEPLREKVYGPLPPGTLPPGSTLLPPSLSLIKSQANPAASSIPNVQAGTVPVGTVADTNPAPTQTVVGQTPGNILNITPPLAPLGDTPAPTAGAPALAPNAGPLGGLFLGA